MLKIGKETIRVFKINELFGEVAKNNNVFAVDFRGNSGLSIKDIPAYHILYTMSINDEFRYTNDIVTATSGNFGIGLAWAASKFDLKCHCFIPETMTLERRAMMKAFGAEVYVVPKLDGVGMNGATKAAISFATDENAILVDQFSNKANVDGHLKYTMPVLNEAFDSLDIINNVTFVAGVGSGGHSVALKKYFKNSKVVAVEPSESPILTRARDGKEISPSPHKIQGISAGFIPSLVDLSLFSDIVAVNGDSAIDFAKYATKLGFPMGISSGANIAATLDLLKNSKGGETFITFIYDHVATYLSHDSFK
jgi:cysteine synthase A